MIGAIEMNNVSENQKDKSANLRYTFDLQKQESYTWNNFEHKIQQKR